MPSTAFIRDPPLEITERVELKFFIKGISKMPNENEIPSEIKKKISYYLCAHKYKIS